MRGRLGRQPVTAPSNESVAAVPVFTPDPHGAAMFAGIINGTLGHLGGRPMLDASKDRAWHGWTAQPQGFRGAAGASGGGRPVVVPGTRLDQASGSSLAPDPIQSIFEERMGARRFE